MAQPAGAERGADTGDGLIFARPSFLPAVDLMNVPLRSRGLAFLAVLSLLGTAVRADLPIPAAVDFGDHLRPWDGFGVNYVETAQTRDYATDPQEYGGLSLLSEADRERVFDLIFGDDGLKPALLKMFLDPWHEAVNDNDDPAVIRAQGFDHETTTRWMRLFAREGLKRTRNRGDDLTIITTLYGPPPWTTRQGFVRGRDLDPALAPEVAEYMIAWVKFLRDREGLPVKYLSLHNEGEDYVRWPDSGENAGAESHDYNLYWPPAQVVAFLRLARGMLDGQGLADVGLTPGETTSWTRFHAWGYASAVARDEQALASLGLITSHGFVAFQPGRWFADWRSTGNDLLRARNPALHSWVTSQSWGGMDAQFIHVMQGNIYVAKANGIIPWAVIQRPQKWVGGDPNPGTAFRVSESGTLSVQPGYFYYKQVCRAGQPGMAVAQVSAMDTEISLIGFASNGTAHPDALVVCNPGKTARTLAVQVRGTPATRFNAYRTSPEGEAYAPLGDVSLENGLLRIEAPSGSVTTLFAR